jgi:hypothetical protein
MTLDRRQREKVTQQVKTGSRLTSTLLDASSTVDIITFGTVAEKVSFQGDGDLAGTVEFSIDGINWKNSTAIGATNAIVSFNTHNSAAIRVTRSGGSGRLHVAIK